MKKAWRWLWKEYWDFCDLWYSITGTRIQAPVEIFFPHHCEWVFRQWAGINKGMEIKNKDIET